MTPLASFAPLPPWPPQAKRPQLRTWLEAFGEVYSKGVIAAALGLLCALLVSGVPLAGAAGQRGALYRAMGLLTVASPCALVMVPLAYVAAIAAAASRWVVGVGARGWCGWRGRQPHRPCARPPTRPPTAPTHPPQGRADQGRTGAGRPGCLQHSGV